LPKALARSGGLFYRKGRVPKYVPGVVSKYVMNPMSKDKGLASGLEHNDYSVG